MSDNSNSSTLSKDEILKKYINEVFDVYDPQGIGKLNSNNITSFFNDLFKSVGVALTLTPQQTYEAIKAVHPSYNNQITK